MPRTEKISRTDINIRPCRFAKKPEYKFVVTGPQSGGRRRWRKFFAARAQADAYAQLRRVELSNVGTQGATLTSSQRAEYLDCLNELQPYGVSLRDAIKMLLPTLSARRQTVPVEKAVAAMLKAQEADGASRRHLEDLRSRLGKFARAFPNRGLATISTADLDTWVRGLAVGNLTRNNFRRVIGSLFAFGRARGWCIENPASALAKAKVAPNKIGILTPQQTASLLENAPSSVQAALAIAAFTGLRRAELERLDWREVKLAKGLVEVTAGKSKTAARRFVPIRENLRAWLAPLARAEGMVCPPNFRLHFDAARKSAGLDGKNWPDNGLRHSFASYHAAQFQDAGKLASEMGHTTPTVVFQHYRELVEPEEAERYWDIRPASEASNIVPITAGVAIPPHEIDNQSSTSRV